MPDVHARFSPSSAERLIHCPPSLVLGEEAGPEDNSTEYTAEGTEAHTLCEYLLKSELGEKQKDPRPGLNYYSAEMEECANGYKEEVKSIALFIPKMKEFADVMCVNLGIKRKDFEIVQFWDTYIKTAHDCVMKLLAWNVWDKTFPGSIYAQQAMFPLRHEFVFVFGEKAYKLNRTIPKRSLGTSSAVRPIRTRRQTDGSMKVTSARPKPEEVNKPLESVIAIASERGAIRSKHPAVMPVGLPAEYIKAMTDEGDYVLEPFAGSGTTLIACEQTGRRCLAMEISPEYCEVIKERYEKETSK